MAARTDASAVEEGMFMKLFPINCVETDQEFLKGEDVRAFKLFEVIGFASLLQLPGDILTLAAISPAAHDFFNRRGLRFKPEPINRVLKEWCWGLMKEEAKGSMQWTPHQASSPLDKNSIPVSEYNCIAFVVVMNGEALPAFTKHHPVLVGMIAATGDVSFHGMLVPTIFRHPSLTVLFLFLRLSSCCSSYLFVFFPSSGDHFYDCFGT